MFHRGNESPGTTSETPNYILYDSTYKTVLQTPGEAGLTHYHSASRPLPQSGVSPSGARYQQNATVSAGRSSRFAPRVDRNYSNRTASCLSQEGSPEARRKFSFTSLSGNGTMRGRGGRYLNADVTPKITGWKSAGNLLQAQENDGNMTPGFASRFAQRNRDLDHHKSWGDISLGTANGFAGNGFQTPNRGTDEAHEAMRQFFTRRMDPSALEILAEELSGYDPNNFGYIEIATLKRTLEFFTRGMPVSPEKQQRVLERFAQNPAKPRLIDYRRLLADLCGDERGTPQGLDRSREGISYGHDDLPTDHLGGVPQNEGSRSTLSSAHFNRKSSSARLVQSIARLSAHQPINVEKLRQGLAMRDRLRRGTCSKKDVVDVLYSQSILEQLEPLIDQLFEQCDKNGHVDWQEFLSLVERGQPDTRPGHALLKPQGQQNGINGGPANGHSPPLNQKEAELAEIERQIGILEVRRNRLRAEIDMELNGGSGLNGFDKVPGIY